MAAAAAVDMGAAEEVTWQAEKEEWRGVISELVVLLYWREIMSVGPTRDFAMFSLLTLLGRHCLPLIF